MTKMTHTMTMFNVKFSFFNSVTMGNRPPP